MKNMTINVSDIMKIVEEIAPLSLAENWDNPGLQAGQKDWPVKKVLIALDPLDSVVEYACSIDVDLLITHHPLIFRPISSIDFSTPSGKIIKASMENRLAIYSAHTNFDSSTEGLNDILANKIGLREVTVLGKPAVQNKCKLVFFVPASEKNKILKALFETTAGIIGNYTCCSFLSSGSGTYKPGENAKPFSGKNGEIVISEEVRIETIVNAVEVEKTVNHIKKQHPYETMAYDVYPLAPTKISSGLGRVGTLPEPLTLADFAMLVKEKLGIDCMKFAGDKDLTVKKVALCTGSGSSLMKDFFKSGADVYLSGDLNYHDARAVEEKGLGLVDSGHFASEILMVEALQKQLEKICSIRGYDVEIEVCPIEEDPFIFI